MPIEPSTRRVDTGGLPTTEQPTNAQKRLELEENQEIPNRLRTLLTEIEALFSGKEKQ